MKEKEKFTTDAIISVWRDGPPKLKRGKVP